MKKCGKECEVYSRVVGYYRPVKNWNKGKQAEFAERVVFVAPLVFSGACIHFDDVTQNEEFPLRNGAKRNGGSVQ